LSLLYAKDKSKGKKKKSKEEKNKNKYKSNPCLIFFILCFFLEEIKQNRAVKKNQIKKAKAFFLRFFYIPFLFLILL
jgi:hypothetical protein